MEDTKRKNYRQINMTEAAMERLEELCRLLRLDMPMNQAVDNIVRLCLLSEKQRRALENAPK